MRKLLIPLLILLSTTVYADTCSGTFTRGSAAGGGGYDISETFDNVTNWTNIAETLSASGGKAHGTADTTTLSRHNTQLSSADHWVEGKLMHHSTNGDYNALVLRCASDGSHYVKVYLSGGYIRVNDDGGNWSAEYNGSYSNMTEYTVKATLSGTNIIVTVDGVERINYSSALNNLTGQYVGVRFVREYSNADVTIDDFTADTE